MKKIEETLKLSLADMQTGINKIDEFRRYNSSIRYSPSNYFENKLLSTHLYKII